MRVKKSNDEFRPGHGYSREDWDDVADNPEWTAEDFRKAKPFAEVFPELAESIRQGHVVVVGDPDPTETVSLDRTVVQKFRDAGGDWRERINEVLRKAVGL